MTTTYITNDRLYTFYTFLSNKTYPVPFCAHSKCYVHFCVSLKNPRLFPFINLTIFRNFAFLKIFYFIFNFIFVHLSPNAFMVLAKPERLWGSSLLSFNSVFRAPRTVIVWDKDRLAFWWIAVARSQFFQKVWYHRL